MKQNHMCQYVEIGVGSVDIERENNHVPVQLILAQYMFLILSLFEGIIKP